LLRHTSVELDTHAWVEAYVPSVGWLGLDPTHGQLIGGAHVALAVGRDHSDVPPQRGVNRGHAQQQPKTRVRSQDSEGRLNEELLAPRRVNNRMIIELMLHDRNVNANSLEQQILQ
jgi:transglutaminase-like putative cysteine protease